MESVVVVKATGSSTKMKECLGNLTYFSEPFSSPTNDIVRLHVMEYDGGTPGYGTSYRISVEYVIRYIYRQDFITAVAVRVAQIQNSRKESERIDRAAKIQRKASLSMLNPLSLLEL